jgi:hypothetical protein
MAYTLKDKDDDDDDDDVRRRVRWTGHVARKT